MSLNSKTKQSTNEENESQETFKAFLDGHQFLQLVTLLLSTNVLSWKDVVVLLLGESQEEQEGNKTSKAILAAFSMHSPLRSILCQYVRSIVSNLYHSKCGGGGGVAAAAALEDPNDNNSDFEFTKKL